ncbi:hypothetical protein [Gordonia sp. QH-12]|uniref:hypothetical protein n=1 Tax=Gordonia sp. QH-12 TaxID=1437876 RepID=UPI0012E749E7|nr:hypothetical protein [Gordonia sp. QH-12]
MNQQDRVNSAAESARSAAASARSAAESAASAESAVQAARRVYATPGVAPRRNAMKIPTQLSGLEVDDAAFQVGHGVDDVAVGHANVQIEGPIVVVHAKCSELVHEGLRRWQVIRNFWQLRVSHPNSPCVARVAARLLAVAILAAAVCLQRKARHRRQSPAVGAVSPSGGQQ